MCHYTGDTGGRGKVQELRLNIGVASTFPRPPVSPCRDWCGGFLLMENGDLLLKALHYVIQYSILSVGGKNYV